MKKIILAAASIIALASCGNNADNNDGHNHDHDGHGHSHEAHEGHDHAKTEATAAFSDIDPVCDMTRNADWDAFSVNG